MIDLTADRNNSFHFRLAPTPSGFLHVGNAANFLFTWLLCQWRGGKLLLRIDDMDRERFRKEYLEDIFQCIEWLGISYDEGPSGPDDFNRSWSQVQRFILYEDLLDQLAENICCYSCTCSRSDLENGNNCNCEDVLNDHDKYSASLKISTKNAGLISFKDGIKNELKVDIFKEMPSLIIRKKDRAPSYQICSLADDLHFNITHIIRGEDLIGSTAAQIYISRAIGNSTFCQSAFFHHPLVTDIHSKKLSKSDGDISIQYLRKRGIEPDLVVEIVSEWLGVQEKIRKVDELLEAGMITGHKLLGVQTP